MNIKSLRICHAIVRFDNVPSDVSSGFFEKTCLPLYGNILECEYLFRRNVTIQQFERTMRDALANNMGKEILRLLKIGCRPVLHLDFNFRSLSFFRVEMDGDTLRKLSRDCRSIELSFPSCGMKSQMFIQIPFSMIRMLARYGFCLEIV